MIIEHICIRSFGKLNNINVDLGKNVNIINGANEAGKSTFCNFIKFAFYGSYGTKDDKTKYISWSTKKASGYIDIAMEDGKHYRIDRDVTLVTNNGVKKISTSCQMYDLFTHAKVFEGQVPGEVLFGVSLDIFENTIFVRQLEENKVGGKDLANSIENMLFAADEKISITNALNQLDDVRVSLLYKNEKGGKIYELNQKKQQLIDQMNSSQTDNSDLIANKIKQKKLEASIEKSKQDLDKYNRLIDTYEGYSTKSKMLNKYNELKLVEKLENDLKVEEECEEYNFKKIHEQECIDALTTAQNKLENLKFKTTQAEEERSKATENMYKFKEKIEIIESLGNTPEKRARIINSIEEYNKRTSKFKILYIVFFILSIIFLGVGVTMLLLNTFSPITIYIIMGIGVVFAIVAVFSLIKFLKYNKKFTEQLGKINCKKYSEFVEIKNYVDKDSTYLDVITETKIKADEKFAKCNSEYEHDVKAIYDSLDSCRFERKENITLTLNNAIELCKAKQQKVSSLKNQIELEKQKIEMLDLDISKYTDEELTKIYKTDYDEEYLSKINIEEIRKKQKFLNASIPTLHGELAEAKTTIEYLEKNNVDPAILDEQIQEIDKELEISTNRYNAIVMAQNAISSASGKLRSGLSPKIANSASQYINALTKGKYSKITLNQNLEMCYEYNGEIHPVESLSAGAGDITYMAMRFALIENLYKKYSPPFVFDESFSRLDDDRLHNILILLADLSNNGLQLLIFTCHNREVNILKEYTPYLVHNIQ